MAHGTCFLFLKTIHQKKNNVVAITRILIDHSGIKLDKSKSIQSLGKIPKPTRAGSLNQ